MSTKILNFGPWTYYLNFTNNKAPYFTDKVGKWMYFFDDKQKAMKLCKEAVQNNIVLEAKHSNSTQFIVVSLLWGLFLNKSKTQQIKKVASLYIGVILFPNFINNIFTLVASLYIGVILGVISC